MTLSLSSFVAAVAVMMVVEDDGDGDDDGWKQYCWKAEREQMATMYSEPTLAAAAAVPV